MSKTSAVLIVLASLAVFGATTTGHANEFQSTSRGQAVLIRKYASWDKDCRSKGSPQIQVTEAPSHGTVSTKPTTSEVSDARLGGDQCMGHSVAGIAVYYKPQAGFQGVDTFAMTAAFTNGKSVNDTATISVRK